MSSSPAVRLCFNSNCKHGLERSRKGWRRRSGDFADLCHRCASAYEEGKFCETFHRNASGWRCCDACGKRIHCGCIVSFHTFVLLDAGGIECIACAPKSFILDTGFVNASNGSSTDGDDRAKKPKLGSDHQVNLVDQASPWSKDVKPEYMVEEVLGNKSTTCKKRKSSRIEKDDLIKLEFTWEQAQGLLRPALSRSLLLVVIEGIEFEEYQDAPVIGRPTITATDSMGENIQWAQCEDCLKWRKVPGDASLSSTWTCVRNSWDPERSSCSTAQELTEEQLEELLRRSNHTASENNKAATEDHQIPLNSDEKNQACLDMDCSSPNLKMRNDTSDDFNTTRSSLLPFIGQIDLNIQPESDEELSPGSDSG